MKKLFLILFFIGRRTASAHFFETFIYAPPYTPLFHHSDSLAPRDDLDFLHQSRTTVYDVDFAPRFGSRVPYYLMSGRELITHPSYVGALQRDPARLGYYCGPINGVYSFHFSIATRPFQQHSPHPR